MDGNKKNIDGEVFNNPFQLTASRNGGMVKIMIRWWHERPKIMIIIIPVMTWKNNQMILFKIRRCGQQRDGNGERGKQSLIGKNSIGNFFLFKLAKIQSAIFFVQNSNLSQNSQKLDRLLKIAGKQWKVKYFAAEEVVENYSRSSWTCWKILKNTLLFRFSCQVFFFCQERCVSYVSFSKDFA